MGPCTAQTSAFPTAATPWGPAPMLTWRPTPCCPLSTLCDCGAGARGQAAALACPAGPTPTSHSLTRSTRTPRLVSGLLGLRRVLGCGTWVLITVFIFCSIAWGSGEVVEKLLCSWWTKSQSLLHNYMKYPPIGVMTE